MIGRLKIRLKFIRLIKLIKLEYSYNYNYKYKYRNTLNNFYFVFFSIGATAFLPEKINSTTNINQPKTTTAYPDK